MSQLAFSTTMPFTVGGSVCEVRDSVHFGSAPPTAPHVTVTLEGALLPAALLATTVYDAAPTTDDVAAHVAAELTQPVHMNVAGALLHAAVSTIVAPTLGDIEEAVTTHAGTAPDPPSDGEHMATTSGPGP